MNNIIRSILYSFIFVLYAHSMDEVTKAATNKKAFYQNHLANIDKQINEAMSNLSLITKKSTRNASRSHIQKLKEQKEATRKVMDTL